MIRLILGGFGIIMGLVGIVTNLYILLILVLHKKTRSSSEWILLHLSSCGIGTSLINAVFVGPTLLWDISWDASTTSEIVCDLIGALILILQVLTIWTICALSADRCSAIVSPLRYTQLVTPRRVGGYFLTVWVLSLVVVLFAFSLTKMDSSSFPSHTPDLSPTVDPTLSPLFIYNPFPVSLQSQPHVQFVDSNGLTFRPEETSMELDDLWEDPVQSTISSGSPAASSNTSMTLAFRSNLGLCIPKINSLSWQPLTWVAVWTLLVFLAPLSTLLTCDLIVLSIARRQRHRIVMALYQITLSAQATVTRSKGTAPPSLWMNRAVPAKSRACRAVWEDLGSLLILNSPMILMTVLEALSWENESISVHFLQPLGSLAMFSSPMYNVLLYGVRARPIRATVRSYMRKRMTNSTLQQEIQQRLSPVDGSPRASSRAKSFRSSSPSPNSSLSEAHRRLSTNDLRPPEHNHFFLPTSPSHGTLGRDRHHGNHATLKPRKVRSFLHIPTQYDVQEFWSGLRKPQRSPTIIITHEIRLKDSVNSLVSSSSSPLTADAEHIL